MNDHIENIKEFYGAKHRMPSLREIMDLAGFKSKNAAFKLVNHLVDEGLLKKDATGHILPGSLFNEIRVLGYVEAGFPTVVDEDMTETISLDDYLIKNREATYMFKVKGDSMIDAGIFDGDMVLAERSNSAKNGEIVIAEIDGQWTMKYLRKHANNNMYLQAANKKYKPFLPKESLTVAAVVKAVIRKFR